MGQIGRRRFLIAASASLAAKLASAQQPTKIHRVGYLSWAPPEWQKVLTSAFLLGMREYGYVDGQSVVIEYRRGTTDLLPELAAELVRLKVDVIVTLGTPAARAAKQATSTIPIVITLVIDPVSSGIVPNLARSGGNITGLSMLAPEVYAKAFEIFVEAVPNVSSVAVLIDPTNHGHVTAMKDVAAAGSVVGIKAQRLDVQNAADLDRVLAVASAQRADAFYAFPLRLAAPDWQKLMEFASRNRVPMLMSSKARVIAGGLMSYAVDFVAQVRRTGYYIDKILKGAKPADLPLEQPTTFELAVNLKTAKALGVTVPRSVLLRADFVLE